eukprot:m.242937 g.242937  ORF g.242937 m.242937 type:complete len:56 (+) comp26350_c0_seq4:163-330(+)
MKTDAECNRCHRSEVQTEIQCKEASKMQCEEASETSETKCGGIKGGRSGRQSASD